MQKRLKNTALQEPVAFALTVILIAEMLRAVQVANLLLRTVKTNRILVSNPMAIVFKVGYGKSQ